MKSSSFTAKKALSLLLALIMLISLSGCHGNDAPAGSTESTTEAAPVTFTITDRYILTRPEDAESDEIEAMKLLRTGIKSACGIELERDTDFVMRGAEVEPKEFEILIGATNRTSSVQATEELACLDWLYRIDAPGVITICGGSPEATLRAAKAFLFDIFGYKEGESAGSPAELTVGTERVDHHSYPSPNLTIGGVPIDDYTIVRTTSVASVRSAAKEFCRSIEKLTGKKMKLVTASEFTGGHAIYFGTSGNDGKHFSDLPGMYGYLIRENGGDIAIDFMHIDAGLVALEKFTEAYLPEEPRGDVDIKLRGQDILGIRLENTNGLVLKNETHKTVAAGIEYSELIYRDANGKPVRAYVLSMEKGAGTLYTGTPSDGTVLQGKVSNVVNQMKAADANGKNTIAGINADFFDMGGTCLPRGLCVKNGTLLTPAASRPWFAVRADGSYVLGNGVSDYNKLNADGSILNAVGGSDILIMNGKVQSISTNDFSTIRHPRTAVGYDDSGKVYLLVVDGRQPSISNGASLADLAEIFISLGCTNAINLDGGGSTTMILKDEAGKYVTKNSPSDGNLRSVASTLLVCLPQ